MRTLLSTVVAGMVLSGLLLAPSSQAGVLDKKTILSFSERVQVPGAVLEPGTYVVKRAAPGADPDVIHFLSADERRVHAIALAVPVERERPAEEVTVIFAETPGNAPKAVKEMFFPGEQTGEEFLYPEGSTVLSARAGEPATTATLMQTGAALAPSIEKWDMC